MNPQTINIGNAEIRILSTVKGLVSESQIVENEIESFNPDLVALGMGPEEINGTREWDGEPYDMSGWDEIYGLSLRKIVGDKGVKLPPPSFSTAIKVSDSKKIDVIGIDMDEESFTEAYTKNISTWQLFRRGRLEKSMSKAGIEGKTPEEIALNMEYSIRELSGFAKLESERVKTMVNNLLMESDRRDKILAIIEISNVEALREYLKSGKPAKFKKPKPKKSLKSKEQKKDTKSSVNVTNIYYNIKDSVINRSDLSNKKK